MIGCIHPRSNLGLDRGDCHSFPIEIKHFLQGQHFTDFRKESTLQRTRLSYEKSLLPVKNKSFPQQAEGY
jgi:hypothetical protein